jgi:hypothetical protein
MADRADQQPMHAAWALSGAELADSTFTACSPPPMVTPHRERGASTVFVISAC